HDGGQSQAESPLEVSHFGIPPSKILGFRAKTLKNQNFLHDYGRITPLTNQKTWDIFHILWKISHVSAQKVPLVASW
ncbi:hypothetical protein, partial [uncultured Intestinimonas sp.]|uniref:hypothetical protein n=1 Tax=uncultured Intestinimonas sp. TaxID=1689265 RepID=UPI002942E619